MALRWLSDLVGTKKDSFKIKLATLNASGLSAARTHTLPNASGTLALDQAFVSLGDVSGTTNIDLSLGSVFTARMTGATTFTYSNGPGAAKLVLAQDYTGGYAITWPPGAQWPDGAAVTLGAGPLARDHVDLLAFDGFRIDAHCTANFKYPNIIDLTAATLDSRISTATRSTSQTYFDAAGVLQTAGVNEFPREYDPITGDCVGRGFFAASTNIALYSRDFTNAAWVKTNVTAALDQVGIDGTANSASKLTATAGNGTALQTVTSTSAVRISTCYVKRVTGTGTIEMTNDNGTTWTAVTVTAGWTRVQPPNITNANPTFGFRIVTNGDAIAVDYFHHVRAEELPSPAILTTSAAVTRAAPRMYVGTLSTIGFNAAEGTIIVEAYVPYATSGNSYHLAAVHNEGSSSIRISVTSVSDAKAEVIDAGASQAAISSVTTLTAYSKMRAAFAYKANDFALSVNGESVNTDTAGTVPTVTRLDIGQSVSTSVARTWITSILYIPARISNAELALASAL